MLESQVRLYSFSLHAILASSLSYNACLICTAALDSFCNLSSLLYCRLLFDYVRFSPHSTTLFVDFYLHCFSKLILRAISLSILLITWYNYGICRSLLVALSRSLLLSLPISRTSTMPIVLGYSYQVQSCLLLFLFLETFCVSRHLHSFTDSNCFGFYFGISPLLLPPVSVPSVTLCHLYVIAQIVLHYLLFFSPQLTHKE